MAEIASAYVSLLPSAKGFGSKLNGAIGGDVDKAGRQGGARFGKVFASASMSPIRAIGAAAVGLFAVDKVKDFLGSSIGEAREAQKVSALTGQVIKTTGQAANVSAVQVGNLATAISNKVGIDDEAIQSGENMLLTFTNVRNEVGKGNKVFNQATRLAVDMSTALGGDAKSAALQLGKALNDPAKGVTKLARSGVSFTTQQTEQIKAMQESGNLLGAQKIILGEVAKEFGGAAAAQATAGDKMTVSFGNLKEQVGTALLPILDRVQSAITGKIIPAISTFITQIQNGTGAGGKFRDAITQTVAAITPFAVQAAALATQIGQNIPAALSSVIGFMVRWQAVLIPLSAGIGAMIVAFKVWRAVTIAYTAAQTVLNIVLAANPIGIVVLAVVGLVAALVVAYKRSETFRAIVQGAFNGVKAAAQAVVGFFTGAVPAAFGKVKSAAASALGWVKSHWPLLVAILAGPIGIAALLIAKNWNKITAGARAVLAGVKSAFGKMISFVASIPGKVVSALGNLGSVLFNSGRALLEGFARGITSKVGEVYGAAKSALSKVRNLFPHSPAKEGPFSGKGWTLHSGVALMTGLADGISRSKGKVRSAIMQVLDAVRQQVQQVTSSVSQAFGGDLFSATNAVSFVRNLTATTGMVGRLKSAFAKLMKWGWRPEALSALFQSGNSGLILSLASSQALATQAAHQYQSAQAGLSSLGATVANNQYALGQDRTLKKFDDLINAVKSVGIDVGSEINGAAKKGKKKRR